MFRKRAITTLTTTFRNNKLVTLGMNRNKYILLRLYTNFAEISL